MNDQAHDKKLRSSTSGVDAISSDSLSNTHWTTIVGPAGRGDTNAFGRLYIAYLPPLLTYLRCKGHSQDQAMDVLHSFFERLLDKSSVSQAKRTGKFRSWLLQSLKNFNIDQWRKRNGERQHIHLPIGPDLDEGEQNPASLRLTPEQAYDRKWAITLLQRVLVQLEAEYIRADQKVLFDAVKCLLAGKDDEKSYTGISASLGMKCNTVAVNVKRMRARYAELLRAEISNTVDPDRVEEEWHHLQAAIRGSSETASDQFRV